MPLLRPKWSTVLGICMAMLVAGGQAAYGAPNGDLSLNEASQTIEAVTIPVDPIVEEPIRALGSNTIAPFDAPRVADCGMMNRFTLPVGVLLMSGLGWIPRCRSRRGATAKP